MTSAAAPYLPADVMSVIMEFRRGVMLRAINKNKFNKVLVDVKLMIRNFEDELYEIWEEGVDRDVFSSDDMDDLWAEHCDELTDEYFLRAHFEYTEMMNKWSPVITDCNGFQGVA